MIDLEAIRARERWELQCAEDVDQCQSDRRALLAYVDALREAAGRFLDEYDNSDADGVTLAIDDLRRLLSPAPSIAPDSTPAAP